MAHTPVHCDRCQLSPSALRIDAMPYMPASVRAAVNNRLYPRHGCICHSCAVLFNSLTLSAFFSVAEMDVLSAA